MGVRACVCVKQGIESIIFVVKTAHTHTHSYICTLYLRVEYSAA